MQWGNMGDEKKKETKIEKKDEFGNTVEKTEIEEKEEEDDWSKSSSFFIIYPSFNTWRTIPRSCCLNLISKVLYLAQLIPDW